jgi:hypothetical protein
MWKTISNNVSKFLIQNILVCEQQYPSIKDLHGNTSFEMCNRSPDFSICPTELTGQHLKVTYSRYKRRSSTFFSLNPPLPLRYYCNALLCNRRFSFGCHPSVRSVPLRSPISLPWSVPDIVSSNTFELKIRIACANPCLASANMTGCISSDIHCLCTNTAFISSTTNCIYGACNGTDLQSALATAREICAKVVR